MVFSYPMFRDLEKAQSVFTGIAGHVSFGANLAYQGQTESGGGLLVSGSYFPVLGLRPALGRLLDRQRRSDHRQPLRRGAQPRLLDAAPRRQPERAQQHADGQRPGADDRRRRPARLHQHHARRNPEVFVPMTMRSQMVPGWKGFENRRSYWLYMFARLKPGVSIEQARAAMNGVYKPIINDVEAPLQKGMSDQTMVRFRAKELILAPGEPRAEPGARGGADAADPAVLDHRHRPADCLRQHRQPAARPRRRPRDGDGGAALARRQPPPAADAAPDRVGRAGRARRHRRPRRGAADAVVHLVDAAAGGGARRCSSSWSRR